MPLEVGEPMQPHTEHVHRKAKANQWIQKQDVVAVRQLTPAL